jgi:hypothetical protein
MQSAWINDAEFAGYFVGIDKGYYAEEGLDLTYLPGGPDVIPESSIIAGRADLSLTTPDTTIKAIVEQGAPFKIIGAQYQKNPIGIVSLAKPDPDPRPTWWARRSPCPRSTRSRSNAVLAINGIDVRRSISCPMPMIRPPDQGRDRRQPRFHDQRALYDQTTMGEKAVSFLLYDFGFTIYNDTVVVTEETLRTKRKECWWAGCAPRAGVGPRISWIRRCGRRNGWTHGLPGPAAASTTSCSSTRHSNR